jgi:hypothetical protein
LAALPSRVTLAVAISDPPAASWRWLDPHRIGSDAIARCAGFDHFDEQR